MNIASLFLLFDLIARVLLAMDLGLSCESWESCLEHTSIKIAWWSLLVTQLKGAYLIDLIIVTIVGEQKIASNVR